MIELPNKKKCYNLPEQVAQNLLNIQYLAEQYKNIDELPSIWADYKTAFDADLHTFEDWTTTFEGWENTLATYLANMSSAAVGAISGQNIAPAAVAATGAITAPSITETMTGYTYSNPSDAAVNVDYAAVVKTGNKITFVIAGNLVLASSIGPGGFKGLGGFGVPAGVGSKIIPNLGNDRVGPCPLMLASSAQAATLHMGFLGKWSDTSFTAYLSPLDTIPAGTYYFRYEQTFSLADNMKN